MSITNEMETDALAQKPMSENLHRLFIAQLAEMYDAEKKLALALPIVAKAARSEDLKKLVEVHLKETEGHATTIRMVAESLGVELPDRACKAMRALIKEAVVSLAKHATSPVLDIALIAAAQKIEHYEIAAYGTLCAWATEMRHTYELALLTSILQQERTADELITGVAQHTAPLEELIKKHILTRATADVKEEKISL
jgi:ferritin-like metal-binding protein YciE